jgi:hypothetical protein
MTIEKKEKKRIDRSSIQNCPRTMRGGEAYIIYNKYIYIINI